MTQTIRILGLAAVLAAGLAIQTEARAGTYTLIPSYTDPSGGTTSVLGLNNNGWMTGSVNEADGSSHGFIRDVAGAYTLFDTATLTQGRSLNDSNTVVGFGQANLSGVHSRTEFSRTVGGTVTTLTNPNTSANLVGIAQGINDAGVIVGDYFTGAANPTDGYILDGSTFTDLSVAGDFVKARGINDSGEVVGFVTATASGTNSGFLYSGGVYTFFDAPGSAGNTVFEDINNNGLVVGGYTSADNLSHAFIFNSNTDTFTDLAPPGATNADAFGLNDLGQVVLTTSNADGVVTNYLYSPGVPEPATWALMIGGFGLAGAALRRQRRLAAA